MPAGDWVTRYIVGKRRLMRAKAKLQAVSHWRGEDKQMEVLWTGDAWIASAPPALQVRVQGRTVIGCDDMQSQRASGSLLLQWLLLSPSDVQDGAFWALSGDADE